MSDFEFKPVKSSNIRESGFASGRVRVRFRARFASGGLYEYGDEKNPVPEKKWDKFEKTFDKKNVSSTAYLNKHIKKFPYRKIEEKE